MIHNLATVTVYVEDQERALEFYAHTLGFEIRRRQPMGPHEFWIEVAPPGAETRIVLYPRLLMPHWQQLKASVIFACDDIDATYHELRGRGVHFTQVPRQMPWGRFAQFTDLDSNEFMLSQPAPLQP